MTDNPYINKVEANNQTLIDLTSDTATASDVLVGRTLHLASGAPATGTYRPSDEIEARLEATVGHSCKNLLSVSMLSYSQTGITITKQNDVTGEIAFTATGTNRVLKINDTELGLEYDKTYILSLYNNIADNTSARVAFRKKDTNVIVATYTLQLDQLGKLTKTIALSESDFPNGWYMSIFATGSTSATKSVDVSSFMIRDASIMDDTFEPYVTPTDERIVALEARVAALEAALNR